MYEVLLIVDCHCLIRPYRSYGPITTELAFLGFCFCFFDFSEVTALGSAKLVHSETI